MTDDSRLLKRQQQLLDDFAFLDQWEDKYEYIIDLGRTLPQLSESQMVDANLVKGCQSKVWLTHTKESGELIFHANSDAAIVSGLIAIVLQVFSHSTPQEVIDAPLDFIQALGLSQHLSPMRSNGLASMLKTIRKIAESEASTVQ